MRWLCIDVRFLAGRYHGAADDGRAAQWPPNPFRLMQALVAAGNLGFRRTAFGGDKLEALRWLENRPPPEIIAPAKHAAPAYHLYVPNNDMDKIARAWAANKEPEKGPAELRTGKSFRPHFTDDAPVHFLWPIPDTEWDNARGHAELLCTEARHLHCLGLGIDLVAGDGRILSDEERRRLPGETWIAEPAESGWRVPCKGSLDDLLQCHARSRMRVVGRAVAAPAPPTIYDEIGYRRRADGTRPRRVYAFALTDTEGSFRSFDPRETLVVAAWLRHAAHLRAQALRLDPAFIGQFVCGHGTDATTRQSRLAYLPLPTIPAKGRDGRIRRALLAEPIGRSFREAFTLARRLSGAGLVQEDTGEIVAELRTIPEPARDPVARRYLSSSCRWGTVTPLILPGRDDRRVSKAHALVLKSLAQAGISTPVCEIHLQREPVFPGAEMAHAYRVPAYLQGFPRTHAIITFADEVSGPVAVGSGRHIGLGVFAAMRDPTDAA